MSKITIEIEDTLQDRVDSAIEDVRAELDRYLEENEPDKVPCISNDLDYSGAVHEIIDSAVPIYNKEIDDIFYLHGRDVEAAFDDAGIGDKKDEDWPSGWKPAAIYCYIEQQVHGWYQDRAKDNFEDWKDERREKKLAGIEIFEVTAGDFLNAEPGSWQADLVAEALKRFPDQLHRIDDQTEDIAKSFAGFYWWSCQPGCLPDGEANGPFETAEEAEEDVLSN